MNAVAKRQMIGYPPIKIKTVRIVPDPWVAIGRPISDQDLGVCGQRDAAQFHRAGRRAEEQLNGRLPANDFINDPRRPFRVGDDLVPFLWICLLYTSDAADE